MTYNHLSSVVESQWVERVDHTLRVQVRIYDEVSGISYAVHASTDDISGSIHQVENNGGDSVKVRRSVYFGRYGHIHANDEEGITIYNNACMTAQDLQLIYGMNRKTAGILADAIRYAREYLDLGGN